MLIPSKHSGYQAMRRIYPGGGKGGSSAPAPNPELVAGQLKSMEYQNKAIQQMMDNNATMQPLQKEQMQFGLDSAKTAYGQAQDDRGWMLGRRGNLTGLQDQQIADAKGFNEGNRGEQLANDAYENVTNATASAQGMTGRAMAARGINANSGAAMAALSGNQLAGSMNAARAGNMARDAARQEGYQLTDRASNSLAGYPAMGMAATGAGAGYGASGVGIANSGLAGMNSGQTAVGSAAGGMGSNATGMYGAQANYQTSMDKNQGDGGAGMLVGLAQAGATAWASDRRLKKNIKLVGKTDSGLNVYSFQYKSGGPTVMGVMADEVEQVIPAAVHKRAVGGVFDAVDYSKI